jgi:hypothetical protein
MCHDLNYEAWAHFYGKAPDPIGGDGVPERVVDNLDEVDAYFDRLESGSKFAMTGADVAPDDEGWV